MASSRPRRKIERVRRYDFDEDSDESSEEESLVSHAAIVKIPSPIILKVNLITLLTHPPNNRRMTIGLQLCRQTSCELDFSGNVGWNIDTNTFTEEEYLNQFLPHDLFVKLTTWTNNRLVICEASMFLDGEDKFHYKPTDSNEMKEFIGLTLLMGIIRKPTINSYWNTDDMMRTDFFLKKESMSRDRYKFLLKFLRFSNPYEVDDKDKNNRINDFLEMANLLFQQVTPDLNLS